MQNQKLDAILESFVAVGEDTKDKLLGAAFCVVNKDGILYEGSAGRIDLPVDSPPFTTQSFTWVASMTKIVTAAAAMQEVERGGLGLDQDMRPLVPQLAQMEILRGFEADGRPILEPNANPITLRHLLTHTAGLGYDAADPDLARWSKAVGRTASAYDFSLDGFTTPLKFPSGEGWWYGAGLDWAAEALAAAASARKGGAKTRLADLVQEGILDPLGMQSTTFYSLKAGESLQRRKVATSYRDPETGTLSIGPLPVPSEPPVQSGGGGLWTTCEDFSKFLRAVLVCSLPEAAAAAADAAAGYGGADAAGRRRRRILRPETVAEMLQPQLDDRQREALRSVTAEYHDSMVPEFERTTPLDYGISGIINLADVPSKRKAGSMMWKGFTNGQWWIDPKAGIAAALVINVLPQPDPVLTKLHDELERAVYSDLI